MAMSEDQLQEYEDYIQSKMGTQSPNVFSSGQNFNSAMSGMQQGGVTFQQQKKVPMEDATFAMLSGRTTPGLTAQREGIADLEDLLGQREAQGSSNTTQQVLAGLTDLFSGSKNLANLNAKQASKDEDSLKYKTALQGMKRDLTNSETNFMKSQFQNEQAEERLQSQRDIANLKSKSVPEKHAVPLKEWEAQSAIYGKRMLQAEDVFNQLQNKGYDRTNLEEGLKSVVQRGPFEQLQSNNLKSQQQAERNFLTAVLRKESGASISPSEFSVGEKMYFPRSGDSQEVLAQKAANRRQYLEGMQVSAGTAWDKVKSIPGSGVEKTTEGATKEWQGKTYKLTGNKWVEVK